MTLAADLEAAIKTATRQYTGADYERIINTMESKGHSRETVEKLIDLLILEGDIADGRIIRTCTP